MTSTNSLIWIVIILLCLIFWDRLLVGLVVVGAYLWTAFLSLLDLVEICIINPTKSLIKIIAQNKAATIILIMMIIVVVGFAVAIRRSIGQ